MPAQYSSSTYDKNLSKLGVIDLSNPSAIYIYASSFEAKDEIANLINKYNDGVNDENKIQYTDYIKLIMSSVSTIINAISYILIAFVSISLIVSSIMIGIITYISVLERTKEIGVLRSIGASKKDVSRVFNAETLIIGFTSGMIGILTTLILNIPINIIVEQLTDIKNIAILPYQGAIALVLISMGLTIIAGLLPSRIAAKKDPVEALRSE
jgi:putative ABC transport system permease protein